MCHRIVVLGQLVPILVPFDSRWRIAAQAAEKLAGLSDLDDTRSKQEGEARCRFDGLQPDVVAERFSSSDWMQFWPVLRNFNGQR